MSIAFSIDFPRMVAVEVGGSARKPRLKRVAVAELKEPRNEDGTPVADKQAHLNAQVAEFLKANKLTAGKQLLLAGPDALRFRELQLAFSDRRQIDRVIQFQVEGAIPNAAIEDLSIGYHIVAKGENSTRLLVHAAEKDYIRQRLTALEEGGASIDSVDSHLSGTLNLGLLHEELAADNPPALWLDFAGTTAAVIVVEGGEVRAGRVFVSPYLAGASGATATADQVKAAAGAAQAEAEKRAREIAGGTDSVHGMPKAESTNIGAAEVADRIKHMSRDDLLKFIQRVAVEAKRTLYMTPGLPEPQRLVISGLGAEGSHLGALLANELGLEKYAAVDLMDTICSADQKSGLPDCGELTYLTGVALKGLGRDFTGIDFRYGDLAPGTLMDYARTPLAFAATLALLFGGILFLVSYTHVRRYEADIADLRDRQDGPRYWFDRAFAQVNSDKSMLDKMSAMDQQDLKYPADDEDPANEIRLVHKRLKEHQTQKQKGVRDDYPYPLQSEEVAMAVLRALAESKPSYDFALTKMEIKPGNINLSLLASIKETEEELKAAGGQREADRVFAALKKMVDQYSKKKMGDKSFFDDNVNIVMSLSGRAQPGPEGREADLYTVTIPLRKPEVKVAAKTPAKGAKP